MSGYGSIGDESRESMGREGMDRTKDELAQKAGDVVDQARQQTGQAVEQVRGSAFQMMDQQKSRAADGLGSVAQALHQTGDSLQGDQAALGQYAHRAADTVDQISQQLRTKSVEQLLSEAEQFARREPEVFLGGAVLLGLLASRFLKASSRRSQVGHRGYDQYGYRAGYGRGDFGQGGTGRGEYDRSAWTGEGIDYRSTGTGGYRTAPGGTGTESFGATGSYTAGDISAGRERTSTSRSQRHTNPTGSELDDTAWMSEDDETPGGGTGSSQA